MNGNLLGSVPQPDMDLSWKHYCSSFMLQTLLLEYEINSLRQGENCVCYYGCNVTSFCCLPFKCLPRHKNMSCFNDFLPKKHFFYESHGLPETL